MASKSKWMHKERRVFSPQELEARVQQALRDGRSQQALELARALFKQDRSPAHLELVQKATLAGIPVLAAVSAPSTLAVDLAEEAGLTLVGFLRGRTFNVYAGHERVTLPPRSASRQLAADPQADRQR